MHLMVVSVGVVGVGDFGLIRAGVDIGLENLLVGMLGLVGTGGFSRSLVSNGFWGIWEIWIRDRDGWL